MPRSATSSEEIIRCFDVMVELRPHLKKEQFLNQVQAMQAEGFKLAYIEEDNVVVAVAGYRIYSNLFMGKNLYVDDLVTSHQSRSNGYGEALIQWLRKEAQKENCNILHLDSGTHRGAAHKFYFN